MLLCMYVCINILTRKHACVCAWCGNKKCCTYNGLYSFTKKHLGSVGGCLHRHKLSTFLEALGFGHNPRVDEICQCVGHFGELLASSVLKQRADVHFGFFAGVEKSRGSELDPGLFLLGGAVDFGVARDHIVAQTTSIPSPVEMFCRGRRPLANLLGRGFAGNQFWFWLWALRLWALRLWALRLLGLRLWAPRIPLRLWGASLQLSFAVLGARRHRLEGLGCVEEGHALLVVDTCVSQADLVKRYTSHRGLAKNITQHIIFTCVQSLAPHGHSTPTQRAAKI